MSIQSTTTEEMGRGLCSLWLKCHTVCVEVDRFAPGESPGRGRKKKKKDNSSRLMDSWWFTARSRRLPLSALETSFFGVYIAPVTAID